MIAGSSLFFKKSYHLTVLRAQVSNQSRSSIFWKLSADKLLVFRWSQAQVYFFKFIWNMLCLCATQLKFWFQTDLGCENSASYARKTVAFNRLSAPQENQCLLLHFLTTLGVQEKTDSLSMLWSIMDNIHLSIDSCQSKISADQYHLTVSRAQVSTHRGRVLFLKLSADKLLVFKWSQVQVYFLKSHEICCVYVTVTLHY